jgi:hypothetical protein
MKLPIDVLRAVRRVYAHSYPDGPCADGLAAAMILRDVLPDVEVQFITLNTPAHALMAAEPGTLIVDMTPPADRVDAFVAAGAIVLDHHAGQRALVERFGARGVFADLKAEPGVSAAVLAYREVWYPLVFGVHTDTVPVGVFDPDLVRKAAVASEIATLVGIRDTWQKTSPFWLLACELSSTLLFFDDWLTTGAPLDEERMRRRVASVGAQLLRTNASDARRSADAAFRFRTPLGTRVAVLPTMKARSDAAELLEDIDVVVAFEYRMNPDQQLRLSLRSRGDADCSRIAASLGTDGGGHKGAAGAALDVAPRAVPGDPLGVIVDIMRAF